MNLISASLLRQPDFKTSSDPTRKELLSLATEVGQEDPEFVLKVIWLPLLSPYLVFLFTSKFISEVEVILLVHWCISFQAALYTRCELNIRTTANFLLAFAAYFEDCRPYLKRYFKASIRLPSDWIDVAEQYTVCRTDWLEIFGLPRYNMLAVTDWCVITNQSMERPTLRRVF